MTMKRLAEIHALNLLLTLAVFCIFVIAPVMAAKKVNINTSTVEELQTLPKIGPKIAKVIVEYRKKHHFKSVDELINVKGVGEKKLELLRPLVTLGNPDTNPKH